jgi:ribonuclease D
MKKAGQKWHGRTRIPLVKMSAIHVWNLCASVSIHPPQFCYGGRVCGLNPALKIKTQSQTTKKTLKVIKGNLRVILPKKFRIFYGHFYGKSLANPAKQAKKHVKFAPKTMRFMTNFLQRPFINQSQSGSATRHFQQPSSAKHFDYGGENEDEGDFTGWQWSRRYGRNGWISDRRGQRCIVIDTDEKLAEFLPGLRAAKWVSLDTEADSLHAYPEKLCLIQISIAGEDWLVDPLAEINLNPLLDALNAHELIMHGAAYDLRLLEKHHEFVPSAIFDTMLAARLLGERQFGLSALVEKFLGVKLDKGSQKANWAQRPLTERMEKYARLDTHHLKPLTNRLRSELEARGRLAWHQESCARLIEHCARPQVIDLDLMWRVKGSARLSRPGLAVLRELWRWREREAVRANRPPFFILNHEKLVDIASAAALKGAVESLVPPQMSPRRKEALQEAVKTGLAVPEAAQPEIVRHAFQRPSEEEFRRYRELEKIRDAHANELGIDPTLIASRPVLGDLARDWENSAPLLMRWQRELLRKK